MDAQSHNHKTDTTDPRSGQQIINNARPFASLGLDITRCFVWIRDNLTLTDWNAWALPYIEGIQNAPGPNEVPKMKALCRKMQEPDAEKAECLGERAYTRPGMQMLVHHSQPDLTVAPNRPTKSSKMTVNACVSKGKEGKEIRQPGIVARDRPGPVFVASVRSRLPYCSSMILFPH